MELGIYTFADIAPDRSPEQRMRDLMEEIELADQVGIDIIGIGEHHRADYLVSSPATILAAAAVRTKNIRLTSAVTVLSSEDPIRVWQQFATVDLLSSGRAEIMAGRGSFVESYPLFGFDLNDYDELFAEKLDLLMKLRAGGEINWKGKHRAPVQDLAVFPTPVQKTLPIWIAVGGTPQSAVRAGTLGLPLALAIIGGYPERFAPLVDLYREAGARAGHPPEVLRVGINSIGFAADTTSAAIDAFYPSYMESMSRIGRERGWPPTTRAQVDAMRGPRGALVFGSAQEIIDKIMFEHGIFHNDRFGIQMSIGAVPHKAVLRAIEILGTEVAPVIRRET